MAKKEESPKNVLERGYVIPLRSQTLKVPYYRKAKKAVNAVRAFISKHMKSQDVSIGKYLNLEIWKHGMRNPPGKIKVTATKDDKGKVFVELLGAPKEVKKEETKSKSAEDKKKDIEKKIEDKKKDIKEKIDESLPKDTKAEEAKKIEKEEIKELKKHLPKHAPKQPVVQKQVEQKPTAPKGM